MPQRFRRQARCLIIEDEYFLGEDLRLALESLGAEVIAVIGDLEEAIDQVERRGFEVAVLDIKLRGDFAFNVADELRRAEIPFAFNTGYGREMIPARFADTTLWVKPIDSLIVARDVMKLVDPQN